MVKYIQSNIDQIDKSTIMIAKLLNLGPNEKINQYEKSSTGMFWLNTPVGLSGL